MGAKCGSMRLQNVVEFIVAVYLFINGRIIVI